MKRVSPRFITFFIAAFVSIHGICESLPYQKIGPGVEYVNEWVRGVPWSIHVVKIDRKRTDLKLETTLAKGTIYGLSPLIEQIDSLPRNRGQAVAGINGDFFVISKTPYQGDPRGLEIINGEMVSAPNGEICFWTNGRNPNMAKVKSHLQVIWPDGSKTPIGLNEARSIDGAVLLTSRLGESTRTTNGTELILERDRGSWRPLRAGKTYSARIREISGTNTCLTEDIMILSLGPKAHVPDLKKGMKLKISTGTFPDVSKADFAIGGGPALVSGGKSLIHEVKERHPRTAFGWNDADYFFVVVDGRRKGVSLGMNFFELADLMVSLGCKEAMNLDGGGSSTVWAGGKVLNQPSDNRNRSVANSLICVRKN